MNKLPIVVLISGNGSNLQSMIDAAQKGLPIEIRAVISNRADVVGLTRAKRAHIPTHVIAHQNYANRADFDDALREQIDTYAPKLVALAGFMRKLTPGFIRHYQGRVINIHPSLLPKYPGLHTHRWVLEAADTTHGATIHYANEALDAGPIICQARLTVHPEDTEDTLKQRIHGLERVIYPQALGWIAAGRLRLQAAQVLLDGQSLPPSGVQIEV